MKSNRIGTWIFVCIVISGFLVCPSLSFAGPITVTIDGMAPPSPSSGTCTNANTCVNIGGTYGVLQVVPVAGTCGGGSCARVDVPVAEALQDSLRVTNTRITNTGGSIKTFLLVAWREDISLPGSGSPWYNTDTAGVFGAVAGNQITSRSFHKRNDDPSYVQVGATYTFTVSCPFGTCITSFNNPPTGAQRLVNGSARRVKIELSITLQPSSHIVLNSGNILTSSSNPPDDMEPPDSCPTCTPRAQLSLFCATTHSTAKI
jgi:hypothetical protein